MGVTTDPQDPRLRKIGADGMQEKPHPRSTTMNTETFAAFDPSHYLNTVEDIAAYLEAIIDEYGDDDFEKLKKQGEDERAGGSSSDLS